MWERLGPGLLAALVASTCIVLMPSSAAAFGTIEGGGQHREHERITRAAVACPAGAGSDGDCFEPRSVDQFAGPRQGVRRGRVTGSDRGVQPGRALRRRRLPRRRAIRGRGMWPRQRFWSASTICAGASARRSSSAGGPARRRGSDRRGRGGPRHRLRVGRPREQRAKCASLEAFGRALHGAQDFYSHSNWADEADPARPIGADNPPGLNLPAPSPVLDLRGSGTPTVPADLTTGCFVLPRQCSRRRGVRTAGDPCRR